jgi:hypothetical protein
MDQALKVIVELGPEQGPARRGDGATEELREELARLGAVGEAAERPRSRAIDVAAIGQIVVTLTGAAGGLGAVVETVRSWLRGRAASRQVRLEIDGDVLEVTGLDSDQQQALIDRWLDRHSQPAGDTQH